MDKEQRRSFQLKTSPLAILWLGVETGLAIAQAGVVGCSIITF